MPQGKEVFLGLNQTGVIVFFVCGLLCFPLGFIVPFFIELHEVGSEREIAPPRRAA